MSTIEDFENALVGATATSPDGLIAVKTGRSVFEWSLYDSSGRPCANFGSEEMEHFTLVPSAPTNSREALDLAWELAHPVKEGQTIPKGAKYLERYNSGIREYVLYHDMNVLPEWLENIRTQDPLPEPEPDWLDAPAVLAAMNDCSWQKVWLPKPDGHWECTCCGWVRHWSKMTDVTPLHPKEDA